MRNPDRQYKSSENERAVINQALNYHIMQQLYAKTREECENLLTEMIVEVKEKSL